MRTCAVLIFSFCTLVASARAATSAACLYKTSANAPDQSLREEAVTAPSHGHTGEAGSHAKDKNRESDEEAHLASAPAVRCVRLEVPRFCRFSGDQTGRLVGEIKTILGIGAVQSHSGATDIPDGCQVSFSPDGTEVDRVAVYESGKLMAEWTPSKNDTPAATQAAWLAEMPDALPLLFPWSNPVLALSTNQQGGLTLHVDGVQTCDGFVLAARPFFREHVGSDDISTVLEDKDTGERYVVVRDGQNERRIPVVTEQPVQVFSRGGAWSYVENDGTQSSGSFTYLDENFRFQAVIEKRLGGKDGVLTVQQETTLQGQGIREMMTYKIVNYSFDGHLVTYRDEAPYRGVLQPVGDSMYDRGMLTGRSRSWTEASGFGLSEHDEADIVLRTAYYKNNARIGCAYTIDRTGRLVWTRTYLGYGDKLDGCQVVFSADRTKVDHVAVFEAGELIAEWKRKDVEVEREGGDLRDKER